MELSFPPNEERDECGLETQPSWAVNRSSARSLDTSAQPQHKERYGGGYPSTAVRSLRIATGSAGQSGLLKAWATEFIHHCEISGMKPFYIDWYLGDTTESLRFLHDGVVDIAITYNDAAEMQAIRSKLAVRRVYGFRDHFYLVGPPSDPAQLASAEDVLDAFNRIAAQGNRDAIMTPKDRIPTRFLSRFDKSATNMRESLLFITIGQVPWALAYSHWYHQYPSYPTEALKAAAALEEYTLTDRATWLSSPLHVTSALRVYKRGYDSDPEDLLLNSGRVLLGARAIEKDLAEQFLDWVVDDKGGQDVLRKFRKNGEVLYSPAPLGS